MFTRSGSFSGSWLITLSTALPEAEAFAWVDAALMGLRFERRFTHEEQVYGRVRSSLVVTYQRSASGLLITLTGRGSALSQDEQTALELAAEGRLSEVGLPGFVPPEPPWLSPAQLVSPYPRDRLGRERFRGEVKKPRIVSLKDPPRRLGTGFHLEDSFDAGLRRLRAFVHFHGWREAPAGDGELYFWRGSPTIRPEVKGYFALPGLLLVRVDPRSQRMELEMAIWGAGVTITNTSEGEPNDGPTLEMRTLRGYVKARIRPDGLVRAIGTLEALPAGTINIVLSAVLVVLSSFVFERITWIPVLFAVFLVAAVIISLFVFRSLTYAGRFDRDAQELYPERFTPDRMPLPETVPKWVVDELPGQLFGFQRGRKAESIQVVE